MNKLFLLLIPLIINLGLVGSIELVDATTNKLAVETNYTTYYDYSGDVVITAIVNDWKLYEFIDIDVEVHSYERVNTNPINRHGGWYPTLHYSEQFFESPTDNGKVSWTLSSDKFPYYPRTVTWKVVVTLDDGGHNIPPLNVITYFDTAYNAGYYCGWNCWN